MVGQYDYTEAFSRNLGWLSEYEQLKLKNTRVAIAGMGGAGGIYLLTCARLGIEKFNIAEFDQFELCNFNRQSGAKVSTIGKPKIDVMMQEALDINPNIQFNLFKEGIGEDNVELFLKDCDAYLDGIDLFEVNARRLVFRQCRKNGIPAITHVPIAMGFAQLVFTNKSPVFDDFFDFDSHPQSYHPLLFVAGIAPANLHASSMHDFSRIHFAERKVSSTILGVTLCAGNAVTELMKHVLDRGNKIVAPYGIQYDAHENKLKKTLLRWGNRGPLQRIKIAIIKKTISRQNERPYPYATTYDNTILKPEISEILEKAKWAPSGHDEQLCHLTIISDSEIDVQVIHPTFPVSEKMLHKYALVHFGIYFESLRQAATLFGYSVAWKKLDSSLKFSVSFKKSADIIPEESAQYLRARFTDRRIFKTTPIQEEVLLELSKVLDANYSFQFNGTSENRSSFARAECQSFGIEMRDEFMLKDMIHSIDFENPFSPDKLPFESIDLSFLNKLMSRFFMQCPKLMYFMNRFGGYFPIMFEYAFLKQLRCAGQFGIIRKNNSHSEEDETYIADGQMVQRVWLKATSLGLVLQPSYFQLIVTQNDYYMNHTCGKIRKKAEYIKSFLTNRYMTDPADIIFLGRIGYPIDRKVYSRSTRRP